MLKPRKSNPCVRWTIRVLASDSLNPRTANQAETSDLAAWASASDSQKNNNKDLEIENIAVTLRLAPTPMPGINTAQ